MIIRQDAATVNGLDGLQDGWRRQYQKSDAEYDTRTILEMIEKHVVSREELVEIQEHLAQKMTELTSEWGTVTEVLSDFHDRISDSISDMVGPWQY